MESNKLTGMPAIMPAHRMDQAMAPDFQPPQAPAARSQAAALRSAFPGYWPVTRPA